MKNGILNMKKAEIANRIRQRAAMRSIQQVFNTLQHLQEAVHRGKRIGRSK